MGDKILSFLEPSRKRAFGVILAAGFMTLLDVSIVNVALPSIEATIGTSPSQIEWIVAGYSLVLGITLVPTGRLGDVFGRRLLFIIGLAGFILASAACGFAPNAVFLTSARLIQGLFAGTLSPQVVALIQELYKNEQRARAFALFGMIVGLSTAIGPTLGGILVSALGTHLGWRSVFLINLPIGITVIVLAYFYLPSSKSNLKNHNVLTKKLDLDIIGLFLIGIIVLSLMGPFVAASEPHIGFKHAPWWMLIAAVLLGIAFIFWEKSRDKKGSSVALPKALAQNKSFSLGSAVGSLHFASFTGIFLILNFYYQKGLQAPAWIAGLAVLPFAIAAAISAARSGQLVIDRGAKILVHGIIIMASSLTAIALSAAFLPNQITPWVIPIFLFSAGWGNGIVVSPNTALSLEYVKNEYAGIASGLYQTFQRFGASVGLSFLGTVFLARMFAGKDRLHDSSQALALSLAVAVLISLSALTIAEIDVCFRKKISKPFSHK